MKAFTRLDGLAAPLGLANIDTDQIIPKQFLKTVDREGLARGLFYDFRFDEQGAPKDGFVLNDPAYRNAQILIAGDNFGCGSSREHAPWALQDFGVNCVIAPSFGEIFAGNCFQNGLLPIRLPRATVDALLERLATADGGTGAAATLTVDLEAQCIDAWGETIAFEVEPLRRRALLDGLDEIGLTLKALPRIEAFQARDRVRRPWIWRA